MGWLPFGGASATQWSQLKIGAGGYITGLDIASSDATTVIRTDTFGAYKWNGTGWTLLTTSASMPSGEFGHDASGNWLNEGVYEIVIAPSNTSRFYMMYRGRVFRSDNAGTTWTKTAFTAVSNCDPNDQSSPGRTSGQRMAVDPNNPDKCFVGTASDGLWKTTDGGSTWAQVSTASIPVSTTTSGGILVCFDDVTANKLYCSSYGHGVYVSTDGGSTWTLTTSTPTTSYKMICRGGVLWHIDNSGGVQGALRKYTGTWSSAFAVGQTQTTRCAAVDIDPSNSSRIVVLSDGGGQSVSTDGGSTWTAWNFAPTRATGTGEPGWLSWTNESYMSCGNARFHPTHSNEMWFAEGIGVWISNPPNTSTANAWNAKSQGIEQLVANGVMSPPGGVPLVFSWDRPIFRVTDPTAYPATHGPNNTLAIVQGGSADWASSDPTCIVLLANVGNSDQSSKSTDGGQTWNLFSSLPGGGLIGTHPGGMIAAASNQNYVWIGAQDDTTIYYTTNGGASWSTGSITGPVSGSGFSHNANIDRQVLCADRVNANTFYVYYNGSANSDGAGTNADGAIAGIYKSTNSGATWTKVFSGRFGNSGSANIDNGMGFYAARLRAVPNLGSTSTAGHLFFTCGDVGGSVSGPLYRSTDGGATWSQVSGVLEAEDIGFGAPAPGQSYPAIYIAGWVGGTAESNYGIYRSVDNCNTWVKLTDYPNGNFDFVKCVSGDSNTYGKVYVGFIGSGWAYGHL